MTELSSGFTNTCDRCTDRGGCACRSHSTNLPQHVLCNALHCATTAGDHTASVEMPINRKLQAEMDRTLKRVAEGRAAFEELWQKLDATEVS